MPEFIFKILPTFLNIVFFILSVAYISQTFSKGSQKPFIYVIALILGCASFSIGAFLFDKGIVRLFLSALALFLFTFSHKMRLFLRFLLTAAVFAIVSIADFVSLLIICSVFSLTPEATLVEPIYTLGIIFSFFIAFFVFFTIKHTFRFISIGSFDKRLLLVYLLPASSVIIIFTEYAVFCNCDTSSVITLIMILGAMLLLITNFIIFTLTDVLFMQIETEKKLKTANTMIDRQREEYSKLLNADDEIRRYRHDVKNFLSGILYNLEQDKTDMVKESVIAQLDSFKAFDKYASSKNALNALLSFKAEKAAALNIRLLWEINITGQYSFNDIDLAVLMGNLIDNAQEATEKLSEDKDKKINITVQYENNMMYIIVTNPVKEKVDTSNLLTTKKNKKEHGLGLLSIKSLAQKYNGTTSFSCEDMIFKATVILNENAASTR